MDKVQTRHPERGKSGPRIEKLKYDAFKKALLAVIPRDERGVEFRQLARKVGPRLPRAVRAATGSVSWYVTTVKLDLEARGWIERVPGAAPQRLRRRR